MTLLERMKNYGKAAVSTAVITAMLSMPVKHAALPAFAAVDTAQVTLSWDENIPAPDGYRLFARKLGAMYNYSAPQWSGSATATTLQIPRDSPEYFFVVRAFNDTSTSGDSNEVRFRIDGYVPNPGNLRQDVQLSYLPGDMYKPNEKPQLEGLVAMLNQSFAADNSGNRPMFGKDDNLLVVLKEDRFEIYRLNPKAIPLRNIEETVRYDLAA
jgi:hypothetical protein